MEIYRISVQHISQQFLTMTFLIWRLLKTTWLFKKLWRFIYIRTRLYQASASTLPQLCNDAAILFPLKTMQSLQTGVATHFQETSLFSMRKESQALSQRWTLTLGINGPLRFIYIRAKANAKGTSLLQCSRLHVYTKAMFGWQKNQWKNRFRSNIKES